MLSYHARHPDDQQTDVARLARMAAGETDALGELYEETGAPDRALLAFEAIQVHHPNHQLAQAAGQQVERLGTEQEKASEDPVVVLQALAGRSRSLALARVVDVPAPSDEAEARAPGLGPALGGDPYGPFGGGRY